MTCDYEIYDYSTHLRLLYIYYIGTHKEKQKLWDSTSITTSLCLCVHTDMIGCQILTPAPQKCSVSKVLRPDGHQGGLGPKQALYHERDGCQGSLRPEQALFHGSKGCPDNLPRAGLLPLGLGDGLPLMCLSDIVIVTISYRHCIYFVCTVLIRYCDSHNIR